MALMNWNDNRLLVAGLLLALVLALAAELAAEHLHDRVPQKKELSLVSVTLDKPPMMIDRRRWKELASSAAFHSAQFEYSKAGNRHIAAIEHIDRMGDAGVANRIQDLAAGDHVDMLVQSTEFAEFGGLRVWQVEKNGQMILSFEQTLTARKDLHSGAIRNILVILSVCLALVVWAWRRPII